MQSDEASNDEFPAGMRRLRDEVEAFAAAARERGVSDKMIVMALEDAAAAMREGMS